MSFNLDDPLAGILSDGSDDSFFDDDILGRKKTPKQKVTPTPEKKNALFDLDIEKPKPTSTVSDVKKDSVFDLGKTEQRAQDDFKNIKPVSPAPFKRTLSKESIKIQQVDTKVTKSPAKPKISASADSLDLVGDLNIESRKEKSIEKGKSSQSLLDDILGGSSTKTGSSTSRPTAVKSQEFDFDLILGKSESKPPTSNKDVSQKSFKGKALKDEKPSKKIEDKPPKKTKTSDDWLGIFNDKEETENVADMPAWLGGGDSKKKKNIDPEPKQKLQPVKEPDKEEEVPREEKAKGKEVLVDPIEKLNSRLGNSLIQGSNEDLTTEGAAMYLQQQESQLMIALQLKAQEEKLAAMQSKIYYFCYCVCKSMLYGTVIDKVVDRTTSLLKHSKVINYSGWFLCSHIYINIYNIYIIFI